MKQTALILLFALSVLYAQAQQQAPLRLDPAGVPESQVSSNHEPASQFPDGSAYKNSALTYNIIDAPNHTFGYNVLADGKLVIHQTSIPAMPSNDAFKTKDDAGKVAGMIIYKIRKGEMPPTVTPEEMKQIGVLD